MKPMSKITHELVPWTLIVVLSLLLCSCNKEDNLGPAPTITGFSPNSGIVGKDLTIYGNHFIPPIDTVANWLTNTSIVTFNGTLAEAERLDQRGLDEQIIYTTVPSGATSGKITVTANGITATSPTDFIVTIPDYLPNVTVSTVSTYGGIDLDIDSDGHIYVAQNDFREIFKINPDGSKTTLLLTEGDIPMGIAVDSDGNVYATVGNSIRKISPDGTVIVLAGSVGADFGFADGQGSEARFSIPWGITVDGSGIVYVADFSNNKIRKITPDGSVSTLAGSTFGYVDGPASTAQFEGPIGIKVDVAGNVFVTEAHRIRKITPDGHVSTLVGNTPGYYDGPAVEAQLNAPRSITIDPSGYLYFTDLGNFVVRRLSPDGMVNTVAGSTFGDVDGSGADAKFCNPKGITMDANGALYITQGGGCGKIRKIEIN